MMNDERPTKPYELMRQEYVAADAQHFSHRGDRKKHKGGFAALYTLVIFFAPQGAVGRAETFLSESAYAASRSIC